jgi:hypothetical protein
MRHSRRQSSPRGNGTASEAGEPKAAVKRVKVCEGTTGPKPAIRDPHRPGNAIVRRSRVVGDNGLGDIEVGEVTTETLLLRRRYRASHRHLRVMEIEVSYLTPNCSVLAFLPPGTVPAGRKAGQKSSKQVKNLCRFGCPAYASQSTSPCAGQQYGSSGWLAITSPSGFLIAKLISQAFSANVPPAPSHL